MGMPTYSHLVARVRITCDRSYVDLFGPGIVSAVYFFKMFTQTQGARRQGKVLAMNSISTSTNQQIPPTSLIILSASLGSRHLQGQKANPHGLQSWHDTVQTLESKTCADGIWKCSSGLKIWSISMQDLDPIVRGVASPGLGSSIWSWNMTCYMNKHDKHTTYIVIALFHLMHF